ncbi:16S rRNA (guanine1207-N2)-methyltransferase [Microbacteriaceae bacterium SG_E_30_P1]|uniref:16S rRNA (Guanine1207-N2)-methyltransferase n=1 Tax=Antiquaquibacter oligotrophicus TaxID=2880260 RepID=A0ABT6KR72_9MICO|nr:class I SAM-dependent methyltransferase [Antiquaquibacter oligotrophicus]MDH6182482.1 16S rRNA (guanine1207-N2)-methyltransferase [Antiquaquibacter oligotrophicus]UDF14548.1 methyltransferase [Antiquaquibacter oligotrophicus]
MTEADRPESPAFGIALEGLRRWPDVEAPNLFAVDASDRLILDTAAEAIAANPNGVLVVDDNYGALTLGAIALGAHDVRVLQDSVVAERALAANAGDWRSDHRNVSLADDLSASVVLWQLPRSLDRVDDVAWRLANAGVDTVFAGGRIKHMTPRMNEVLGRHFGRLDVTHARQKSRVLVASDPIYSTCRGSVGGPADTTDSGIHLAEAPGVFAQGRLDIGTRAMLAVLNDAMPRAVDVLDLGSGSGILALTIARDRPHTRVLATDVSAAAIDAVRDNASLNGLTNVTALRDDAASTVDANSIDLVLLNPPFHSAGAVHTGIASKLFEAAARVLRPGGELWTVYNSHLSYRAELERVVGATRQVSRTPKFTVTASLVPHP